jgi:hypothetical protein
VSASTRRLVLQSRGGFRAAGSDLIVRIAAGQRGGDANSEPSSAAESRISWRSASRGSMEYCARLEPRHMRSVACPSSAERLHHSTPSVTLQLPRLRSALPIPSLALVFSDQRIAIGAAQNLLEHGLLVSG